MVAVYAIIVVLIHIPKIQEGLAGTISDALASELGTKVKIERVDLGFLNRIVVDGMLVYDQKNKQMLRTSRISAKIDPWALINGKIRISSAQLFGLNANLYKETIDSAPNYQFLLDSLSSKDTVQSSPLDLRIGSLVIRNGAIKYNNLYTPEKHDKFDVNHINISKLSSHIMLYELTDSTIDINVKHLALQEKSGIAIKHLGFQFKSNDKNTIIDEFSFQTPYSDIYIPEATLTHKGNTFDLKKASYYGMIDIKRLSMTDIAPFVSYSLEDIPSLSGNINFKGKSGNVNVSSHLSSADKQLNTSVNAKISNLTETPSYEFNDISIESTDKFIAKLADLSLIPSELTKLGNLGIKGNLNGVIDRFSTTLNVNASTVGSIQLMGKYNKGLIDADIETKSLNLSSVLSDASLGNIAAAFNINADISNPSDITNAKVNGNINEIEYNGYTFHDILIDAKMQDKHLDGMVSINDANISALLYGNANIASQNKNFDINLEVVHFYPQRLNLSKKWGDAAFDINAKAKLSGTDINDIVGDIIISEFYQHGGKMNETTFDDTYSIKDFCISSKRDNSIRSIQIKSNILDAQLNGIYNIETLPNSITSLIARELPTVSQLPKTSQHNNFRLSAELKESEWLNRLLGIDVNIKEPLTIEGFVNDIAHQANIYLNVPSAQYSGYRINDGKLLLWTPDGSLRTNISFLLSDEDTYGEGSSVNIEANAENDVLSTKINWDNKNADRFSGNISTTTRFLPSTDGKAAISVGINDSDIHVGDSIWQLHSDGILYANNKLNVKHFTLGNLTQHINIDGVASDNANDSLIVDLKNVDVGYILDLVNFHSVEFDGFATGRVIGKHLYATPEAHATLNVREFKFQEGNMGDLHILANLNNTSKQIDIKAFADDENGKTMTINGYVSPQREDLDLHIDAHRTNLEFMEYFCKAFLKDIDAKGIGNVRVYGDFSEINLTGEIVANGAVSVIPLNCRYSLRNDTIKFIPNDIVVNRMPLYDTNGSVAYMSGGLHHKYLTRMTYDFNIEANNFLCYDFKEFGDNTFYGTAYLTGTCNITGRSSELTIDVNGDVQSGSKLVYNASSPDAITRQEFITWHSANPSKQEDIMVHNISKKVDDDDDDVSTNIHMNFLFNVTPESTLSLLMDPNTGDYIDLHGSGVLRASYYNKGTFDLFGNYIIDSGTYRMTIQNVMRRDFEFQKGGTITFGGDPYNAALNMQALYIVNSVPLSDLNIGNSFSSNNIRVNCLMNITGTPGYPKVDFSMDMPTVNAEAKQMIYSIINGEEEMNQQVLYLLSVGRFYSQLGNNAGMQDNRSNSATSLAMQSLLSGTLSQQINNVLSSVINNQNWNFGANISPGDEGFTNAEYEGLLNGSLFDNRLQFNGQFGYRDNAATSQQGFIGDFDIKYNLLPSGNLAVRVYNQTNDRYFTRNSLNTQGLGLILKKDFNSWKEFFTWRKRKKKTAINIGSERK